MMTGMSIAAFALTAEWFRYMPLSMVFLFIFGAASSAYMISIMNSLQMMVPDQMRGRVMGFYGMTWNIMPLGGMYAGALAAAVGAPWTIAIGGFLVSGFALGPALLNRQVRDLGHILAEAEDPAAAKVSA